MRNRCEATAETSGQHYPSGHQLYEVRQSSATPPVPRSISPHPSASHDIWGVVLWQERGLKVDREGSLGADKLHLWIGTAGLGGAGGCWGRGTGIGFP